MPVQQVIQAYGASREEIIVQREVFAVAADITDRLDGFMESLTEQSYKHLCLDLKVPVQFSPS